MLQGLACRESQQDGDKVLLSCKADEPGACQTTFPKLVAQGRGGQIKLGGADRSTVIKKLMAAGAKARLARETLAPFSIEASDAKCLAYHAALQLPP